MSVSHLLVATDALVEGHRTGTYVAVCGEPVSTASDPLNLPCDPQYCERCVRAAITWNARQSNRLTGVVR